MIIADTALKARAELGRPLKVAIAGAGFMGRSLTLQIARSVPGMEVVAIGNRTIDKAERAFVEAGMSAAVRVDSAEALSAAVAAGTPAVTDDPTLLARAEQVDVVVEATGTIEFAARTVRAALGEGKHVVLSNAELDATLGPILKTYADRSGVVLSNIDGDQPATEMNLYRHVKGMGFEPLLCGNIKGLMDHYRTPTTQAPFAAKWDQDPRMVTSFADGSKISFEQTVIANATGMGVATRGMVGYEHPGMVDDPEHLAMVDLDRLRQLGGVVDYVVGARPGAGVYILAAHNDPREQKYLDLYKMGPGPLYCFYQPFHLCYFEVPLTIARAALLGDAAVAPLAGPVTEVVATAKHDLKAGESLDGIGGYTVYGQMENAGIMHEERLLPIGLSDDCVLTRDIAKDDVVSFDDVEVPSGRLIDRLYEEQLGMGRRVMV